MSKVTITLTDKPGDTVDIQAVFKPALEKDAEMTTAQVLAMKAVGYLKDYFNSPDYDEDDFR
jgi:hypothetical protein